MTTPTVSNQTVALTLFSRQFATMIHAGVSLVRCLAMLEEEAPAPYAAAAGDTRKRVEDGDTLAKSIESMPDLFPPFYLCMVRAGEVGGVLDEALNHLAELLHDDWSLSGSMGSDSLLFPAAPLPESWHDLPEPRRALLLSLFCRAYGMMLKSGVPIVQASVVAADFLPTTERTAMLRMVDVIRNRGDFDAIMAELSFLPPIAQRLYHMGMETGTLDACVLKLADLYRYQVMYQRG